jgi:uncharacterized protein
MHPRWKDKKVLITGASSGIGASFAKFLAKADLHVLLTARRLDRLEKLQADIRSQGGKANIYQADLGIENEREKLFKKVETDTGPIDILINNAGFGWYGYFHEMKWSLAKQMSDVNIHAIIHLTNLFLPGMQARKSGHIINIGSIAGGLPNQGIAIYSASKAFLDAFSTSLYRELRGSGVYVSAMRLGPVKTEFYDHAKRLENGKIIPAEKYAISTDRVNSILAKLIDHPKRFVYVPNWLGITKFIENLFGWAIDLLGPLLLKKSHKKT